MGWMPISPWRALPGVAGQNLTFSGTSAQSAAFQAETRAIQISAITANCRVRTGKNPTAVSTDMLIKATDPPLVLAIGNGELLAVIQDTAGGTLSIIEVSH
jgi:hypothetical protein